MLMCSRIARRQGRPLCTGEKFERWNRSAPGEVLIPEPMTDGPQDRHLFLKLRRAVVSPMISKETLAFASVAVVCTFALAACGGGALGSNSSTAMATDPPPSTSFTDSALASNKVGVVATTTTIDANLSNPWGIAVAPGLPFWISDNNSNLSTLYSGTGAVETQEITGSTDVGIAIPSSASGVQSNPTGQVYNGA